MRRRPVCILCMLLVVFLCVTDWLGFSLIRGNPLPQSVQTWIRKHPESTICGEVVRCRENEDFQSVTWAHNAEITAGVYREAMEHWRKEHAQAGH